MRLYFFIFVIFFLHQCAINENKTVNEKNLISAYNDYSFNEYVNLLFEENKSKDYLDINNIQE